MIEAMLLGGLRRSEVLGLRLEDLRSAERRVFVADGKGGHQGCRSRPGSSPR
jgi:integrase/recombinase XerD